MNASQIRKKYIDFFSDRGHKVLPRAQLVPQDDATTLFTGSGMQPLVPYLLGEDHPEGVRLVDSQTCLRAEDIEEVGDNRHTTFFEMLGNWSLGDYFKGEELSWLFEFLTKELGLNPQNLYVTCFGGDTKFNIPKDEESAKLWQDLYKTTDIDAQIIDLGSVDEAGQKGMQNGRIFYYDGTKNWWSRGGAPATTPEGDPCGPDSEVFYEFTSVKHDEKYGKNCHPNCDCGRFLEIGNSVFMSYKRQGDKFTPLTKKNVDFGAGLERLEVVLTDQPDIFQISLLKPLIDKIEELTGKKYSENQVAMRVIADHLRASVWLAVDGVVPSNNEQGYVMRRLVRRALRYGLELGIENDLCDKLVQTVIDEYKSDFPEVADKQESIKQVLNKEEKTFRQTLRKGVHEFDKLTKNGLEGEQIFKLYDTYGFPKELSIEEANSKGVKVAQDWQKEFDSLMKEQKERSRTASKGHFKGGLAGQGDIHKKYHTATHLMYKALRMVLGDDVVQKGSNITDERLRFDFTHDSKMTPEQIKQVEDIVNEQIKADLDVDFVEMPTKEALAKGALGAFGDKYGDSVKVYSAGKKGEKPFSFEICGGPHVSKTSQLSEGGKSFKIKKEESSSAGDRRIKAVLQ